MDEEQRGQLPGFEWMASRIPLRDALTALVPPDSGVFPEEKLPPGESRWYPQDDGSLRLRVPYDGRAFDTALFQVEPGGWDHTTCDYCVKRLPPMTLCYVTTYEHPHVELCVECYETYVIRRRGLLSHVLWKAKRLIGIDGPT